MRSKIVKDDFCVSHIWCTFFFRLHVTTWIQRGQILLNINCWIYLKFLFRKFNINSILAGITVTLHEDICTFKTRYRSDLLTINVSGKTCSLNKNPHFISNNFLQIWHYQTNLRWQCYQWPRNTTKSDININIFKITEGLIPSSFGKEFHICHLACLQFLILFKLCWGKVSGFDSNIFLQFCVNLTVYFCICWRFPVVLQENYVSVKMYV